MHSPRPRGPQSHLDVAWLWRYDPETIEVCIPATFGLAADNLERFPDFSFAAGQAPLFEGMRKYYPRLASRIEKLIREGRFEIVGGHCDPSSGIGSAGKCTLVCSRRSSGYDSSVPADPWRTCESLAGFRR